MTPEQRHAYLVELVKAGFSDGEALKVVDEADKRIKFEDDMAAWRRSLTAVKTSDRPHRKSPPKPQPPVPVFASRPQERAHTVIVRQVLQATRPSREDVAQRRGFMAAFQHDFEKGLQELAAQRPDLAPLLTPEDIAYIVGADAE